MGNAEIPAPIDESLIVSSEAHHFYCDEGVITANFTEGQATLALPGNRTLVLPQSISASGARYEANGVVFWNKGDSAFITEGDKTTYGNCLTGTVTADTGTINRFTDVSESFSVAYPPTLVLSGGDTGYTETWRQQTGTLGMTLVKIRIPKTFQPETNFSEAIFTVGTSADPDAVAQCLTDANGANVEKSQGTMKDVLFTKLSFSDAGAGNYYDTTSYRTVHDGQCYAIEYTIHSTNLANYSSESGIKAFDRAKIKNILEAIVESFAFLK